MADNKKRLWLLNLQNGIRDVFDANTEADQKRRLAAGQPRWYQDQQSQKKAQATPFNQPTKPVSFNAPKPSKPKVNTTAPITNSLLANKPINLPTLGDTPKFTPGKVPEFGTPTVKTIPIAEANKEFYAKDPMARFAKSVSKGIGRSVIGTGQSAGGLFDAVSPGKGQSGFTKQMTKNAEGVDQEVKDLGLNKALYTAGQIATDVGTFALPGGAISKAPKLVSFVPGVGGITRTGEFIASKGKLGKNLVAGGKVLSSPQSVANIATDAALGTGFRSAREEDISAGTVAQDVAISTIFSGLLEGTTRGIKKLFNNREVKKLVDSTDVQEIKTGLERRYPQLQNYDLDYLADRVAKATSKKEVEKILEDTTSLLPKTPNETVEPPQSTTNIDTNTTPSPSTQPLAGPVDIKKLYPQLDVASANDLSIRLQQTTDPIEITKILDEAKARNQAIVDKEIATATAPEAVKPEEQVMTDTNAPLAANPVKTAENAPQTPSPALEAPVQQAAPTVQDLNTLGVTLDQYLNQPLPERKPNAELDEIINATADLKDEGFPNAIVELALNDPTAPTDATGFKNFVRRLYGVNPDANPIPTAPIDAPATNVPEGVDPITGEIAQPAPKDLMQVYDEAPAPGSGTQAAEQFINDIGVAVDAQINKLDAELQSQGKTYQEFHDEIQAADRYGTDPAPWAASIYADYVRPYVNRAAEYGGKVDQKQIDAHPWYLPQRRPTQSGDDFNIGDTMIDLLDIGDSGFSLERQNALGLNELDNTTAPLRSYFIKNASLQHMDDFHVQKMLEKNPDMTPEQATTYVKGKREQMQDMDAKSEDGGMFATAIDDLDYATQTRELGKTKGEPTITVKSKYNALRGSVNSSDEMYRRTKFVDTDGQERTMKEAMGFDTFYNAQAYGDTTARNAYQDGQVNTQAIIDDLTSHAVLTKIDESQINQVGERVAQNLRRHDDINAFNKKNSPDYNKTEQQLHEERASIIADGYRQVGKIQANSFAEQVDFTGPQHLKKNFNRDIKDMLLYNKTKNSLAEATTNIIRGTIYRGFLGYNPLSALQNITELRRAYGLFGEKGFSDAAKKALKDEDIVKRYGVREVKHGKNKTDNYAQSAKEGGADIAVTKGDLIKPMGLFNATEQVKDAVLLHGLEAKYIKQGLTGTALKKAVLEEFDQVGFKGGRKGSLGFNKQKVAGTIFQFMQYSVKDWKYAAAKIKQAGDMSATIESRREAQKYLARKSASDVALYLALNWMVGATAQSIFNYRNPAAQDYNLANAPGDVKAAGTLGGFTGAGGGLLSDVYVAVRMNQEAEKDDNIQKDGTANVAMNQVKRNAAVLVPGGNQIINKTGGFLTDMRRGYNENSKGMARFTTPTDAKGVVKGLVLGRYQTDEAKKYFDSDKIASDVQGLMGRNKQEYPVSQRYQDEIDKAGNIDQNPGAMISRFRTTEGGLGAKFKAALGENKKDTAKIANTIDSAREASAIKKDFAKENPEAKKVADSLYATKKLPNGKTENDTIGPEKWSKISTNDATGEAVFNFLKKKAQQNAKDFGDPIDPIFDLSPSQRKTIIALRSMKTGDDLEAKGVLKQEQWYNDFADKEKVYYGKQSEREFAEGDFVSSPRVKQYYALSQNNPKIPEVSAQKYPIISQYYTVKDQQGPDAAKAFYKANAATLGKAFESQADEYFAWINDMRALEGVSPLSQTAFKNASYGFESDEAKLASELFFKNGGYGGGYGKDSTPKQYLSELLNGKEISPQANLKLRTVAKRAKLKSQKPIAKKNVKKVKLA